MIALVLLILALVVLDRAGAHVRTSDGYAVVAVAILAGAVAA